MTSKEAITKLNVLSSYDTSGEYKECIYAILKDLDVLEILKSKTMLLYSDRKKVAKEYEEWCKDNNAMISDTTNMITWFLRVKLEDWLENDKQKV